MIYCPFYQTIKYLVDNFFVILDNEFLKTFETKTVKHKDLFLRMKVKKTLPMRTPFVTSISVHYNKQILCARFGNHIRQTDKWKLDWKTPMKLFFYAIVCWLSKKTVQFPYLKYHLLFQLQNIFDIYYIFVIFIIYLWYICNIFILISVDRI